MKEITHTAILTALKKKKVDEILPELFCEMVQTAVVDLADLDVYEKRLWKIKTAVEEKEKLLALALWRKQNLFHHAIFPFENF